MTEDSIKAAAVKIESYQELLNKGELTQAEFIDLCTDVTKLDLIQEKIKDLRQKETIEADYLLLLKLANLASSV